MRSLDRIKAYSGPNVKIMEVCGTHTSSIIKNGLRDLLPKTITLVSGPGCPVCVTPPGYIDELVKFSMEPNTEILSFGDMLKVPGTEFSLSDARARGGKVRVLYSPLQAVGLAKENPNTSYVFAAVGFETTAPVYCVLLESLAAEGIENVKIATAIKTVTPALRFICENEKNIDAFISPGHVSVITGACEFVPLCEEYKKPFVVTGFKAEEILDSIAEILRQLESGAPAVSNQYKTAVRESGNLKALELISRYFEAYDTNWRGIGVIPKSGLRLRAEYSKYSTEAFDEADTDLPPGCSCSDVILGRVSPCDCPLYKTACTPESPIGPCMVSSEGACGIWFLGNI